MSKNSTAHINVLQGEIAKTVLMPGDPLRAKFIADEYLENVVCFNNVRGMLGYTGLYKGKQVSVMGSGMGMPSMGIYSYELFKFFDVETIIRIGSAGAYDAKLDLYDLLLVKEAWSESTYARTQGVSKLSTLKGDTELNNDIMKKALELNKEIKLVKVHSSDVFYRQDRNAYKHIRDANNCVAVEMEAFALFANAFATNKKAAVILTVSDNVETGEETSALERQNSFNNMMELALEMA